MDFKYKPGDQVQVQANAFYKDDRYHMLSGPLTDKLAENTVTISERTIDIRNSLSRKINEDGYSQIESESEYYYAVGQLVRYYISLSKSKDKGLIGK